MLVCHYCIECLEDNYNRCIGGIFGDILLNSMFAYGRLLPSMYSLPLHGYKSISPILISKGKPTVLRTLANK